jgi:hypothetical protein
MKPIRRTIAFESPSENGDKKMDGNEENDKDEDRNEEETRRGN